MDALRFRLDLWGVTRYRAEEIPELSAALSRQAGIADKGIPETMASARPAAAPLVSEFRRLLRADAEDSKINVLLALCRCGAGFRLREQFLQKCELRSRAPNRVARV